MRWSKSGAKQRMLAIASPGSGEGRSYVAANLAVAFSQLGERTLLVDADRAHRDSTGSSTFPTGSASRQCFPGAPIAAPWRRSGNSGGSRSCRPECHRPIHRS